MIMTAQLIEQQQKMHSVVRAQDAKINAQRQVLNEQLDQLTSHRANQLILEQALKENEGKLTAANAQIEELKKRVAELEEDKPVTVVLEAACNE